MPIYPYSFQLPPLNVQDIPNDGVPGEFLGISAGGALDWLPVAGGGGSGDLLAANNLSELTNFATARTNIGLGTTSTPTFANLTLTSPSLSSSAPVTISQTWAGTGSTVFKALVVNAVSTASAAGSFLLDLQLGGVSKFSVYKDGNILLPNAATIGNAATSIAIGTTNIYPTGSSGSITTLGTIGAPFLGAWFGPPSQSAFLTSDSLNTLALRNGAAAQTFRVYNTFPGTGNNEYGEITWNANTLYFRPAVTGTATIRNTVIGSSQSLTTIDASVITFRPNGAAKFGMNSGGFFPTNDNQVDIGFAGGNRFKDLHIGSNIYANGNVGIGTTAPGAKLHVAGTIKPEQATMVDIASTTINLEASNAGTIINCTAATAVTVNLPTLDTNAGYNVMIIQSGAGAVTIAANGNTRNSFGSAFTTAGQHAACSIVRIAASTYNLSGNLV